MTDAPITRWQAIRLCLSYPQFFQKFWGKGGHFRPDPAPIRRLDVEKASEVVDTILDYYSKPIASKMDFAEYLTFEIHFGLSKHRGGYLMQPEWAEVAISGAREYESCRLRLMQIVATNMELGIAMPSVMFKFFSENTAGKFPSTQKRGPSKAQGQLRKFAFIECLDVLVSEAQLPFEGNELSAVTILEEAYGRQGPRNPIAAPSKAGLRAIWYNENRDEIRSNALWFRFCNEHHLYNAKVRPFYLRIWMSRARNLLSTCIYFRK
jgi:hypothetical protein